VTRREKEEPTIWIIRKVKETKIVMIVASIVATEFKIEEI
jgi:hypothetical protein